MSDHPQIQAELPAFVAGRLDADAAASIEEHLAGCDECAAFVADWRTIQEGFTAGGTALAEAHPDALVLKRFAEDGLDRAGLQAHLDACESCRLELEVFRRQPARASARRGGRVLRIASAALAAGLVLGAGLGWFFSPERPGQVPGGALTLYSLEGDVRGDTVPEVALTGPLVGLVLAPELPEGVDAVEIAIVDADGRERFGLRRAADDLRRDLDVAGVVSLAVPAESLPPGRYTLRLAPAGGEPFFDTTFRTVAAD